MTLRPLMMRHWVTSVVTAKEQTGCWATTSKTRWIRCNLNDADFQTWQLNLMPRSVQSCAHEKVCCARCKRCILCTSSWSYFGTAIDRALPCEDLARITFQFLVVVRLVLRVDKEDRLGVTLKESAQVSLVLVGLLTWAAPVFWMLVFENVNSLHNGIHSPKPSSSSGLVLQLIPAEKLDA